jgi:hypothetical protein
MEQESPVLDLHHKIADWRQEVDACRQQFDDLAGRLVRAVDSRQPFETRVRAERFQNQLICQKEVADELVHDLKQARKRPAAEMRKTWARLEDRVQTFRQLFFVLKRDLDRFAHTVH